MVEIAKLVTVSSDKEFVFERCIKMYGSEAAKNHGAESDETSVIFRHCIDSDAKSATNRKGYESVCHR